MKKGTRYIILLMVLVMLLPAVFGQGIVSDDPDIDCINKCYKIECSGCTESSEVKAALSACKFSCAGEDPIVVDKKKTLTEGERAELKRRMDVLSGATVEMINNYLTGRREGNLENLAAETLALQETLKSYDEALEAYNKKVGKEGAQSKAKLEELMFVSAIVTLNSNSDLADVREATANSQVEANNDKGFPKNPSPAKSTFVKTLKENFDKKCEGCRDNFKDVAKYVHSEYLVEYSSSTHARDITTVAEGGTSYVLAKWRNLKSKVRSDRLKCYLNQEVENTAIARGWYTSERTQKPKNYRCAETYDA
ncbi:hypothetical protein ACFLZZ_00545 [Nanoarchaeota archaeon]